MTDSNALVRRGSTSEARVQTASWSTAPGGSRSARRSRRRRTSRPGSSTRSASPPPSSGARRASCSQTPACSCTRRRSPRTRSSTGLSPGGDRDEPRLRGQPASRPAAGTGAGRASRRRRSAIRSSRTSSRRSSTGGSSRRSGSARTRGAAATSRPIPPRSKRPWPACSRRASMRSASVSSGRSRIPRAELAVADVVRRLRPDPS